MGSCFLPEVSLGHGGSPTVVLNIYSTTGTYCVCLLFFFRVLQSPLYHITIIIIIITNSLVTASISFRHTSSQKTRDFFFQVEHFLGFFCLFVSVTVFIIHMTLFSLCRTKDFLKSASPSFTTWRPYSKSSASAFAGTSPGPSTSLSSSCASSPPSTSYPLKGCSSLGYPCSR